MQSKQYTESGSFGIEFCEKVQRNSYGNRGYNVPMAEVSAKKLGWFGPLLAALFGLAALGFAFLPLLKVATLEGIYLYWKSFPLFFGGEESFVTSSGSYVFDFSINIYLLIALQLFVLGALSTGLGRRSFRNLIFGLILYSVGLVFGALTPLWVKLVNPGVTTDGLHLAYGFFLMEGSLLAGIATTICCLVKSKRYRASITAER